MFSLNLAIIFTLSSVFANPPPKVKLPHGGVLVGSYMETVSGETFEAYRGIPYAQPPVGKLRFAAPEPASKWSGDKLADADATMCPQQDPFQISTITLGNEDCLYVNVYKKESQTNKRYLPVMFFIHGGGWYGGAGISQLYGPGRLLENDVVLVTSNYRLGPLGFLSTGTLDCPGNNGLKDQVLALKWVQKNIRAFGGDPKDVTIFGQSAGSASVTYHMVSSMSKGLFHKAILESGTSFNPWALTERSIATVRAAKLGALLNCTTTAGHWKEMIGCLRTKSADAIISTMPDFYDFLLFPPGAFTPVVEPNFKGAFLAKHPRDIETSHSNSIPVIIGVTTEEGLVATAPLLNLYNEQFTARFSEALPIMLFYDEKPENVKQEITNKIDEFYFQGRRDWTKENHLNLTNLFTDCYFYSGINDYLRNRFAITNCGDTYVYLFDHRGPLSFTAASQGGPEYYGVTHSDELFCLFVVLNDTSIPTGNDAIIKWAMPEMWTNFAKTGNPTPSGSDIKKWKRATQLYPLNYAHLGSKFSIDWTLLTNKIGLVEPRIQFWNKLRADYNLL